MKPAETIQGTRIRVVLDTNILASALAFGKGGPPQRVVELARNGLISAFTSQFILSELERVLAGKAGWDDRKILMLRRQVRSFLGITVPRTTVREIRNPDADNRILECAVDAGANYLITGDLKHIRPLVSFRGIRILTPREFLDTCFPQI